MSPKLAEKSILWNSDRMHNLNMSENRKKSYYPLSYFGTEKWKVAFWDWKMKSPKVCLNSLGRLFYDSLLLRVTECKVSTCLTMVKKSCYMQSFFSGAKKLKVPDQTETCREDYSMIVYYEILLWMQNLNVFNRKPRFGRANGKLSFIRANTANKLIIFRYIYTVYWMQFSKDFASIESQICDV